MGYVNNTLVIHRIHAASLCYNYLHGIYKGSVVDIQHIVFKYLNNLWVLSCSGWYHYISNEQNGNTTYVCHDAFNVQHIKQGVIFFIKVAKESHLVFSSL